MRDASECLTKGDYVHASEKLWGATVTIIKAILILTTLCGGTKKTGKTIFAEDLGFGIVVVRDMPATVCSKCGAN